MLWILLVPLGIVVVAATVIGIPLAFMSVRLFVASLYLAPRFPPKRRRP
jgi:hypothetical protein